MGVRVKDWDLGEGSIIDDYPNNEENEIKDQKVESAKV